MFKAMKKITSIIMSILILSSILSFGAVATPEMHNVNYDDQIDLCWDNLISSSLSLGFNSSNKIEGSISLIGQSGTKYKNGTIKIDRYTGTSWVNVKTWSNQSSTTRTFTFTTNTLTALSNTKYRLTIEITAYNGSTSEVLSFSKTSTNS